MNAANDAPDGDPVLALMEHWRTIDRKLAALDEAQGRVFPAPAPRLEAAERAAVEELLSIERQIVRTPAASLAGAIAKLEISLFCYRGRDLEELASEHALAVTALAVTALEDLRRRVKVSSGEPG